MKDGDIDVLFWTIMAESAPNDALLQKYRKELWLAIWTRKLSNALSFSL